MQWLKDLINWLCQPTIFFVLSIVVFGLMFWAKGWTKPRPAMVLAVVSVVFFTVSMFDPNFRLIVAKPDNVPIAGMLFLVGFFTWLAFKQAFDNDERIASVP